MRSEESARMPRLVSMSDLDRGIRGVSPDEADAIERICVHAILATPAAQHLEAWRVTDIVNAHVKRYERGRDFDFTPVLQALLKVRGVTEQDLYVGILNVRVCLAAMGIHMDEPAMKLEENVRRGIVETARAASHSARAAYELRRLRAAINRVERERLGDMLVNNHFITAEQLEHALEAQQQHGRRLGTNLVELGYISASSLAHFLGDQLDIPCVTFIGHIEEKAIAAVPKDFVRRLRVMPLNIQENGSLTLAMEDPLDLRAIEEIVRYTGRVVHPVVAPESVLVYAMARHYGQVQPSRVRDG